MAAKLKSPHRKAARTRRGGKSSRVEIRLTPAQKKVIERATAASGLSMSSFILSTAVKVAQETIEKETTIALGREESNSLLELLREPPKPTAAALRAARRYVAGNGAAKA